MRVQTNSDFLENGMRVVSVELPHLHSSLLALYVRAGSRHETAQKSGVGHFLEHMFFRGSAAFPDSVAMNGAVEDAGGNLNGYTSRDHAFYFTPLHESGLGVGMTVLADMIGQPLLKEIELEREIILEEMLDEVDETGRDIDLDNLSKAALWPDHPLSLKIAGRPETVRAMTVTDLQEHHARFYGGRNLVLCAAGPLRHERVLELAHKGFGRLPAREASAEAPPPAPPKGPRLCLFDHDESQTEFRFNFLAPPEGHPEHLALQLLRRILDDGLSSRLPLKVVERKGLAYSLHCNIDLFNDAAVFEVEAAASHGKVPATLREIAKTLEEIARTGPTHEEMRRAIRRSRMAIEAALDSTYDMAAWFGGTALFREPQGLEERARAIEAIEIEDVQRVARAVFTRKNLTVTAVGSPTTRQRAEIERAVAGVELL
jgi:predicted Zn-dependent peptidase